MAIKYKIEIENSDLNWNIEFIKSLHYFDKFNSESRTYEFRKDKYSKYPSVIMEPYDKGLIFIDNFYESIGRELMGLLVERVTGEKGFIKIDEE